MCHLHGVLTMREKCCGSLINYCIGRHMFGIPDVDLFSHYQCYVRHETHRGANASLGHRREAQREAQGEAHTVKEVEYISLIT